MSAGSREKDKAFFAALSKEEVPEFWDDSLQDILPENPLVLKRSSMDADQTLMEFYDPPTPPEKIIPVNYPTINDYNTIKVLGKGGFGEVVLVEDKKTKRRYASKSYLQEKGGPVSISSYNSELFKSFSTARYEIDILSRMVHPNILSLEGVLVDLQGDFFEVRALMEVAQMDLDAKLKSGTFPMNRKRLWFFQLLSAMQLFHNNGYVHCDLKLNNILVTPEGDLKLSDPGLSFHKSDVHHIIPKNFNCGALYNKAPEYILAFSEVYSKQFRFDPNIIKVMFYKYPKYDAKSVSSFQSYVNGEFFSLGIVLLEILEGRHIIFKKVSEQLKFIADIGLGTFQERKQFIKNEYPEAPEDLLDIITGMVDGNPKTRTKTYKGLRIEGFEDLIQGVIKTPEISLRPIPPSVAKELPLSLRNMVKLANASKYNLYQLANGMSYFRYVLEAFPEKSIHTLIVCSLFMVIGRSQHLALSPKGLFLIGKMVEAYQPYPTLKYLDEVKTDFIELYRYMAGITHVKSIGDYVSNGNVMIRCFDWYLGSDMPIEDYVVKMESIVAREKAVKKEGLISRSEYLTTTINEKSLAFRIANVLKERSLKGV